MPLFLQEQSGSGAMKKNLIAGTCLNSPEVYHIMKPAAFLFLFVCLAMGARAQKLNREEKKILETIHASLPQHLKLLQQLVDINSGSLNIEGVKANGELLAQAFRNINFTTEWMAMPDSVKRAGHLVASTKGKKGKRLLLIGHLDTVFEPDMPANPFRMINDSTATGQGVVDMKGGNVIILAALHALHKNGLLKDVTITAYFTGDEENTGRPESVTRGDFIARAKQHDVALGFEGAQGLGIVATGRRGYAEWLINVYGEQGHSAGIFRRGYGAIYEVARIIEAFRVQLGNEEYLTFNPGIVIGGTEMIYDTSKLAGAVASKINIISPAAVVHGEMRFLTTAQKDSTKARMQRIATSQNLPGTRATISFKDGMPSMEPTAGNNRLVAVVSRVSQDLGFGTVTAGDPGQRGAGDISYVASYLDAIDGLGAEGQGAHAPGETMNLASFEKLVQRAAILIYRLTREK